MSLWPQTAGSSSRPSLAPSAPLGAREDAICHWIAVRTESQREKVVAARLERELRATVYLPLARVRSPAGNLIVVSLFRPYVFCDIDASPTPWQAIRRHCGVVAIVMTSPDLPGRCPDSEILKLRMAEVDGVVRLAGKEPTPHAQRPAIGSKIKMSYGPLAGHEGVYAAHKGAAKARVIVFLLGREVTVEISAGSLAAIAA
jgi:transcription antitermination factor NusG